MNAHGLQYAHRELRRVFGSGQVIASLIAVSLVLGLSRPFGTDDMFHLGVGIVYWGFVANSTFFVGSAAGLFAKFHIMDTQIRPELARVVTGICAAFCVTLWVVAVNWVVLALNPISDAETQRTLVMVFLISLIVSTLFQILDRGNQPTQASIMERLSLEKRGFLMSMSVQDHYVKVVTTKGSESLLMRLSDAMKEACPANGMQVHRSHWISLDHVVMARKQADRTIVVMRDGREIPVSRSYIKELKAKGITANAS